jgi:hypothetical protein
MSSTSAAASVKRIDPDDITERYSNLSREDKITLGEALLRDNRIITLLKDNGIKDTSPIQLIFKNTTANKMNEPIKSTMLKLDITNLITKMQLKGKQSDMLFTVLDEIMDSLTELGGGARRRKRKTKKARKTRRTRRNKKQTYK